MIDKFFRGVYHNMHGKRFPKVRQKGLRGVENVFCIEENIL